jgi:hypothetical protein
MQRLEQFWFVREPAARYYWGQGDGFVFSELNSRWSRPKLWVFVLKCPKIGSNSR